MADSAFSFDQSLLFASEIPDGASNTSHTLPLTDLAVSQDSTTQTPQDVGLDESLIKHAATTANDPPEYIPGAKTATAFDGSTFTLRPRTKKTPVVTFSDADTILDMDALYERVGQRELIRKSRKTLEGLRKPAKVENRPQLWTDKYKPASFLELCSAGNERQFRQILNFLRKWNTVVRNEPVTDEDYVDHLGRPLKKVLLVHGASGSGKTLAVHLLARQMGYVVQELNAANSMDTMHGVDTHDGGGRFANATAALKLKVQNALTVNTLDLAKTDHESAVHNTVKPTCLVVDEIDSSINAGDIVRVITDLVLADGRSAPAAQTERKGQNTKAKKPFVLRRPIICIANDIYTHSVRTYGPNPMDKLRPICETVAFKRPVTSGSKNARINVSAQKSVKELLMKVSDSEKLGLDSKAISEIFEVCEGDIRACLNYMQFTSRKLDPDMHAFLASSSGKSARKDESMSWFAVVDQIFERDSRLSKDENFDIMFDMMFSGEGKSAASGSLDKIIRGCFNKYLDVVHLQDDSLVKPAEISDWLYYYDTLNSSARDSFFYPALVTLKFWSLFSEINVRKINDENSILPNARSMDFESMELAKQNKTILRKLSDQLPLDLRLSFCGSSSNSEFYACQFIPFLDTMLTPEIGSAKIRSSLKPHEKVNVEKLAHLVKQLDIKLETSRDTETNQTSLSFAPNWDTVTVFETEFAHQLFAARAKALFARRLWLFPILQSELEHTAVSGLKRRAKSETPSDAEVGKQKKARISSSVDYFKNKYDLLSTQLESPTKLPTEHISRIWVKYHEGFSNAVRKNIGWSELWAP